MTVPLWWRASDGPYARHLRFGLLRPFGVVLGLLAVVTGAGSVTGHHSGSGDACGAVLTLVVVAAELLLGISSWRGRLGPGGVAWLAVAALLTPATPDVTGSVMHLPASLATSVCLIAIGITCERRPALVLGLALLSTNVASGWWWLPGNPTYLIDMAAIQSAILLAGTAFLHSLVLAARETDVLAARADEVELGERRRSSEIAAADRARALVHGRVIYALEAIARGAPALHCRRACALAVDALTASDDGAETDGALSLDDVPGEVRRYAPIAVGLTIESTGVPADVPQPVVTALVEAAGEAIRNSEKHAGVDRVAVRLSTSSTMVRLEISDAGQGVKSFEPSFGTTESILGTMRRVGGDAQFRTGPTGTTVSLTWEPPAQVPRPIDPLADCYHDTMEVAQDTALFGAVGWPLLVGQCYLAARYSIGAPHAPMMMALAITLTMTMVATIRVLQTRPLRTVEVALWGSGLAALELAGFVVQGFGTAADFRSWFVGFASQPLILISFVVPWRLAAGLAASNLCVPMVGILADESVRVDRAAGCLVTAVPVMLAWVVGHQIRRSGQESRQERRRMTDALHRMEATEVTRRAEQLHLGYAREELLPWIRRVHRGELALEDPAVRDRARLLSENAHDELDAPGVLGAELRAHVGRFRTGGGRVVLHPTVDHGPAGRHLAAALLEEALGVVEPSATVTLTFVSDDGWSRLSLSPPPRQGVSRLRQVLNDVPHHVREYTSIVQIRYQHLPPTGNGPATSEPIGMGHE